MIIKSKDKILIKGKQNGKTSLAEIISGLNDNFHGDIFLNKRKVKKNELEKIRDYFSIVPQDNILKASKLDLINFF